MSLSNRAVEKSNNKKTGSQLHAGHRQRMRQKYLKTGAESFHPHEMLEMLLFACNPRRDTNPIAHRLIDTFGSFSGVLNAPYEELLKVDGVGEAAAFLLKLLPASARVYMEDSVREGVVIRNSEDAYRQLRVHYVDQTVEQPSALFLDAKHRVINWAKTGSGSNFSSEIIAKTLVSMAMKYNAVYIIMCHNHPSGVALPSEQDCIATRTAQALLKPMDTRIVDHIILGGDDYVSMADSQRYKMLFI